MLAVSGSRNLSSVPSRYPIHFAVPAWGKDYVGTYLEVCLPAQLARGNLGALSRGNGHRYTIYTRSADVERIRSAPAISRLRELIDVDIEIMDSGMPGENKYHVKTDCYQRALRAAVMGGAALFALNCDMVLADGFVGRVVEILNTGVRLIEVPGSRTIKDEMTAALLTHLQAADGSIAIPPLELAGLWLRHRHPQLEQHSVKGLEGGPFQPSHLFWDVGDEGVLIRAFHVYPMVTRSLDPDTPFATLDDDLAANMAVADNERYWARDSRDLFCCELSPLDYDVTAPVKRGDHDATADFYLGYSKENLPNLDHEMIVTGRETLSPQWALEREAFSNYIDEIKRRYVTRRERARAAELEIPHPLPVLPGQSSDVDALAELRRYHETGQHPPAELRERCGLIELAKDPNNTDQVLHLCTALVEQGKRIPLILQQRALEAYLQADPARDDLRARLQTVSGQIRSLS